MKFYPKKLLTAALVACASMAAYAEIGVVVIASNGDRTEVALPDVQRIDIGTEGITLHHAGQDPVSVEYGSLDRILIGAETNAVQSIMKEGDICVWPTAVTDRISVTGAPAGTTISVFAADGRQLAATKASAGAPADIDMSAAPAGVYVVTVGKHSVKVIKK